MSKETEKRFKTWVTVGVVAIAVVSSAVYIRGRARRNAPDKSAGESGDLATKDLVSDASALTSVVLENNAPRKPMVGALSRDLRREDHAYGTARSFESLEDAARALTALVREKDVEGVSAVLDALVGGGAKGTTLLSALLQDNDHNVKEFAAIGLARIGDREAVYALAAEMVHTDDAALRANLKKAFGQLASSKEAADALVEIISEDDQMDVISACRERLVALGSSDVVYALAAGIPRVLDPRKAKDLITALSMVGSPDAVGALRAFALNGSADARVRIACLSALGTVGNDEAIDVLREASTNEPEWMLAAVVSAISSVSNPESISDLVEIVTKDSRPEMRSAAVVALSCLSQEAARAALESAARSEQDAGVKEAIRTAIGRFMATTGPSN